jgi:hypothetical protein
MAGFITALLLLQVKTAPAHEPLFGIGPHVLFKGGFAPHITFTGSKNIFETEYALGYGITRNWTAIGEIPFALDNKNYSFEGFNLKQKYRFYSWFKPGLSRQVSAVSKLVFPAEKGSPTVVNLGLTGGQEALRWYWFFSAGYAAKFTDENLHPGNNLDYTATIGYRPFKTSYYKPDLVVFLEGIGRFMQKSKLDGLTIENSGGHAWSVAPTFMFTYRNIALRGGIETGIGKNGYLEKPETNYKFTLEWHL